MSISEEAKPRLGLFLREGPALWLRFYKSFGFSPSIDRLVLAA